LEPLAIYQISQRHATQDPPIDHTVLTPSVIIPAATTHTFKIFMKNKSATEPWQQT